MPLCGRKCYFFAYFQVYEADLSPSLDIGTSCSDSDQSASPSHQEWRYSVRKSDSASRKFRLISPVVMCGPQGLRFLRPVELTMPRYHRPNAAAGEGSCSSSLSSSSSHSSTDDNCDPISREDNDLDQAQPATSIASREAQQGLCELGESAHDNTFRVIESASSRLADSDGDLGDYPISTAPGQNAWLTVHRQSSRTYGHRHAISLFHASAHATESTATSVLNLDASPGRPLIDLMTPCPINFTFRRWNQLTLTPCSMRRPRRHKDNHSLLGGREIVKEQNVQKFVESGPVDSINRAPTSRRGYVNPQRCNSFISVLIDHF
ncbi:unnamed protein product [Protopolystoma xenopodis]|uniref:ZU5 domain-containing protein n=1 Tax=Protopolystoma xenopodis TaxID=117903 RepID=A0A448XBJ6_9PLAT|nr:unnamed protein product [Protopolystoma xenopodis]